MGHLEALRCRLGELDEVAVAVKEHAVDPAKAAGAMAGELRAVEWGSLDGEAQMASMLALEGARRTLDGVIAAGMGALQFSNATFAVSGHDAVGWRSMLTHGSRSTAKRDVMIAGTLERFEGFRADLAAGVISADHVAALAGVCNPRILEALVGVEGSLLHMARTVRFEQYRRYLRVAARLADQDGPEPDCGDVDNARMGVAGDGGLRLFVELSGHSATVAERIIKDETDRQYRAAVAEHDAAGLPVPPVGVLRARAIVELVRRGAANTAEETSKPRCEAILPVTVDDRGRPVGIHSTDGEPLDETTAAVLACDAWFQPVVIDSDGTPLCCGRSRRWFNAAQRRALIVRDGGCVFPGCDAPASWCDAHHIIAWICGGRTDIDNGGLLCRRHHGLVHGRNPWILEAVPLEAPPDAFTTDHRHGHGPGAGPGSGGRTRGVRLVWHTPDGRIIAAQTAAHHRPNPPGPEPPGRQPAA